jgi:hypothetical protein
MKANLKKAGLRVLNTVTIIGAVLLLLIWGDPLFLILAGAWQCRVWAEQLIIRANRLTDKLIDDANSNNSTR